MPKVWRLAGDVEGETSQPQLVNSVLAQLLARYPGKLKKVEAILKTKFSDMPSFTESEE